MPRGNRKKDYAVAAGAQPGILPAGTPDWITPELVEQTVRVWQPFYQTLLTPEDAVTIILNVGRMFQAFSGSPP
jgi:hypothetical protein